MQGRWKVVAIAVVAFALGGAAVAVAASRTPHGAVRRTAAGAVMKVAVAQSNDQASFTNTGGWVDFNVAVVNIRVPAKQRALLIATFSGETECGIGSLGNAADECDLRIMVDGRQMSPGPVGPNNGAAFDSHGFCGGCTSFNDYREMHAIQRSRVVGPGFHTVQIQVQAGASTFQLDAWQLTVESAKVG